MLTRVHTHTYLEMEESTVETSLVIPSTSLPIKGATRVVKSLSENKLKRLNILTFINDKKEILFTKKAFKFEKERIWRQIFKKMLDFGMVSSEKDWRYVRDVSFSNWRKRAQKRLKHLAASGHRMNMDECEFLIYDILGQTPDKSIKPPETIPTPTFSETATTAVITNGGGGGEEEESDEYMIDSDEEDEDDVMFDEMLYIPKIVFSDNVASNNVEKEEFEKQLSPQPIPRAAQIKSESKPESKIAKEQTNCRFMAKNCQIITAKPSQEISQPQRKLCNNGEPKSDSTRLLDLEIENKILKNRYMKLKIFELEQSLGLDHCKEVNDLIEYKFVQYNTNGSHSLMINNRANKFK